MDTIRKSNSFDPDEARHVDVVDLDLDHNCFQRLSVDNKSRPRGQRVSHMGPDWQKPVYYQVNS